MQQITIILRAGVPVGLNAQLVIVRFLVRCLYWALTLITYNRHFVWYGRLAQEFASQHHIPEKNKLTK